MGGGLAGGAARPLDMVSLRALCAVCGATLGEHRLVDAGVVEPRGAPHRFHEGVAAAGSVIDPPETPESDEMDAMAGDVGEW